MRIVKNVYQIRSRIVSIEQIISYIRFFVTSTITASIGQDLTQWSVSGTEQHLPFLLITITGITVKVQVSLITIAIRRVTSIIIKFYDREYILVFIGIAIIVKVYQVLKKDEFYVLQVITKVGIIITFGAQNHLKMIGNKCI